eukprot:CAMPEP_0168802210 /NCGR_PEP_ID=MMETSP0725-20121227/19954_1 /TAXON_ID=265536 /ORGANISM="Amphiprora sp., Strain CCMP467" /LENGTH=535 /DNA_ID=CAMNT_0008853951 /DNA_START=103 /DNA_END=1711 /DNA_ORIENTATION=-
MEQVVPPFGNVGTATSATAGDTNENDVPMGKSNADQGRGPEDGDFSRDGSASDSLGKRKAREPEPQSPEQNVAMDSQQPQPFRKKERTYFDDIGQESPASYPKHVMVPEHQAEHDPSKEHGEYVDGSNKPHPSAPLLTPDSLSQRRQTASTCKVTADPSRPTEPMTEVQPSSSRTRRWACDFCNVATFLSYEEACAHEEICARKHGMVAQNPRQPPPHLASANSSFGPPPPGVHAHPPQGMPPSHPPPYGQGVYHPGTQGPSMGSQEVVTPPTPHRHYGRQWGSRGPPLPVLPHEHGYYHGYYERDDPAYYAPHDQYYSPQHSQSYGYGAGSSSQASPPGQSGSIGPNGTANYQKRMLLAMPTDSESLSDRQCYVRSEMVEIFAATEQDVAARHSKGAQKLVVGQVGIRCIHCAHLRPRDRAERAVCYPSSISRIYQTVADMQRFHFEHCKCIPKHISNVYKNLKTTRPRGVGSPQTYWVQSAKQLGLVDTKGGIRFDTDPHAMPPNTESQSQMPHSAEAKVSPEHRPSAKEEIR